VGIVDHRLAVLGPLVDLSQRTSSGADDELANPTGVVASAVRVLRGEAFVVVIVPGEGDLDPGLVEDAPYVDHLLRGTPLP
jgi:hypothetical protein